MNKVVSAIALFVALTSAAQEAELTDDQADLRFNPEIEEVAASDDIDYSAYPFIRLHHNKIALNGDDWSQLADKFAAASRGEGKFTVVYLGDSHIQADFGGTRASRPPYKGIAQCRTRTDYTLQACRYQPTQRLQHRHDECLYIVETHAHAVGHRNAVHRHRSPTADPRFLSQHQIAHPDKKTSVSLAWLECRRQDGESRRQAGRFFVQRRREWPYSD